MATVSKRNLIPTYPFRVTMEMHFFCPSQHSNAFMAMTFFACSANLTRTPTGHVTQTGSLSQLCTHTHTFNSICISSCCSVFFFSPVKHLLKIRKLRNLDGNMTYFFCLMRELFVPKATFLGRTRTRFLDTKLTWRVGDKLEQRVFVLNISLSCF